MKKITKNPCAFFCQVRMVTETCLSVWKWTELGPQCRGYHSATARVRLRMRLTGMLIHLCIVVKKSI